MNIALLIEDIGMGGQQTFALNLIKRFKENGCNLFTVYFVDGVLHTQYEDVSHLIQLADKPENWAKATKNPIHTLKRAFLLSKVLREHKIDLVISNATYTFSIACFSKLFVSINHASLLGHPPAQDKFYWKYFNLLPFHKLTDFYLGFSLAFKQLASKGVDKNKFISVGNSVDINTFKPTLSENDILTLRRNLSIADTDFIIGYVGRISPEKELWYLIESVKKVLDLGFQNFKFLIVGDGASMDRLKALIKNYGLEPYTLYLYEQPINEVVKWIQVFDVAPLLSPDPVGGSFPREGMACGRVVVSVDGPSRFQSEWIENEVSGFLVDSNNYIDNAAKLFIELAKDSEKRKRIGAAARISALENLDFDKNALKVLAALKSHIVIKNESLVR